MPDQRRLLRGLWWLLTCLLLAELGVRIATYVEYRRPLQRHPEIAKKLEESTVASNVLTFDAALNPKRFPVRVFGVHGSDAQPTWTTFAQYPPEGFAMPPRHEAAQPGVVRIAFVGGSTTYDGYPKHVAKLLDARFGPGRTEVLNLGVPSSNGFTTLLLMQRFLPRWKPHIVVYYEAFNDLYYGHAMNLAGIESLRHPGNPDTSVFPALQPTRGLWSLLPHSSRTRELAELPWFHEGIWAQPIENDWAMARLGWQLGFDFYVATFAAPDYPRLTAAELDFYDTNLRYLWPLLGGLQHYAADLAESNRRIRDFARLSGAPLIDVAAVLRGGAGLFKDNCHLQETGKQLQAQAVEKALEPRIAALLAAGALPPQPRPAAVPAPALPHPATPLLAQHPLDGTCVQGPCPDDTCLVPAGPARLGYSAAILASRVQPLVTAGIGWYDPQWFEDDGPETTVNVSAFCIDRREVPTEALQRCTAANRCAPYHGAATDTPAVLVTADDAARLCTFRGGRLPTECEWEKAARGPAGRLLPWGDAPWTGSQANFCGHECAFGGSIRTADRFGNAAPSGSFPGASPYGAIDMAGNLWEWTADTFTDDLHTRTAGGSDPLIVPRPGSDQGLRPLLRGGSFASYGHILERRNAEGLPDVPVASRGVRCAYDFGTVHKRLPARR